MGFSLQDFKYNKDNPQIHILEFTFGGAFVAAISLLILLGNIRIAPAITTGYVLQFLEIALIGTLISLVYFLKSRIASTFMTIYWGATFTVAVLSLQSIGRIIMTGFLLWAFILGMIATYQIQKENQEKK